MMPPAGRVLVTCLALIVAVRAQQPHVAGPPVPSENQSAVNQPAATQSATATEFTVDQNVLYGPPNSSLRLDVYQPAQRGNQVVPAVILLHGGGWTSFDKSTMRTMGQFLARWGYVAFAVDYRLFNGKDNPWPAQLDDVQRAVRWIRANAARYKINPDHIGAFGHSAGAQLAALLGMEDTRDNSDPALAPYSSRVQAVVDVSGPIDFTRDHDPEGEQFLARFLGADFERNPQVWQDASPVYHISKSSAPFLIMHGTKDENVPMAQAQEFYDKLKAAGVSVSFIKVEDEHTFRAPENRRKLAIESLEFFNQYLQVK